MKKQILSKIMVAFMVANFSFGGISTFASTSEDASTSTPGVQVQEDNTYDNEVSINGVLDSSYKRVGTLKAGESIKITTTATKQITLLNEQLYKRDYNIDSVQYTSDEKYDYCKYEQQNPTLSVNKGCYTIATNNGSEDVVLCVEKADADYIKIEKSTSPAYEKYTLKAGQKYEISNSSTTSAAEFQFATDKSTGTFDYVTIDSRNELGHSELAENCTYLNIYMNNKARILPKKDMTIGIPYTNRKYISVKTTNEGVLTGYTLKTGETYTLTGDGKFIPLVKSASDDITVKSSTQTLELKNKKGLDLFGSVKSISLKNNESKDVTIWLPSALDSTVSVKSISGSVANKNSSSGGSGSETVISGNGTDSNINGTIGNNKGSNDNQTVDGNDESQVKTPLNGDNSGTGDASNYAMISCALLVSVLGIVSLKKGIASK